MFWDALAFTELDELVIVLGYENACDYLDIFHLESLKRLDRIFGPARDLVGARDTQGALLVKFAEIMLNEKARRAIAKDLQFFGCWSVPHIKIPQSPSPARPCSRKQGVSKYDQRVVCSDADLFCDTDEPPGLL